MRRRKPIAVLALSVVLFAGFGSHQTLAGEADVIDVQVTAQGETTFRFNVTVQHADEGWDHYADKWDVVTPSGEVLGTRVLFHPHVTEQPFTRSDTVSIPLGIDQVIVRAHDSVHGYSGAEMTVDLPR